MISFSKLEESIIGAFDRLISQPLPKPKPVELGDSTENNVANSAISTIVSMGVAEDIARPLVTDALNRNPNLQLLPFNAIGDDFFNARCLPNSENEEKEREACFYEFRYLGSKAGSFPAAPDRSRTEKPS